MIEVYILMGENDVLQRYTWERGVLITDHICGFYTEAEGTCVELLNGNTLIIQESIDQLALKISSSKAFVFNVN